MKNMFRIGQAQDIHRLVENRPLILAGVRIPFTLGLLGHSDADVVYHAVAESILGALALGDLGHHFPDTDERYRGYDSAKIVAKVIEYMEDRDFEINNIDISIIAEQPKLAPFIEQMRTNLSLLLKTDVENVSLKAGTNEKIDEIGRGLAIMANSIVLLRKK